MSFTHGADYVLRFANGVASASALLTNALAAQLASPALSNSAFSLNANANKKKAHMDDNNHARVLADFPQLTTCPLLNERFVSHVIFFIRCYHLFIFPSICAPLESLTGAGSLPVVIYNQLAWYRAETMRLPLAACSDQNTTTVTVVNSVNSNIPSACTADGYLLFQTEEIPPLGYVTYFIVLTSSSDAKATSENLKANQTGFNLFMRKHTHY